jgi:hypothetical protein
MGNNLTLAPLRWVGGGGFSALFSGNQRRHCSSKEVNLSTAPL